MAMLANYIMSNIISIIMDIILDSLYIGLLAFAYYYLYITPRINTVNDRIKYLEDRQEILYQAIIKLRNIANIDTELRNEETKEITKINNLLKIISKETGIEYPNDISDSEKLEEDNESEPTDSTSSPKNNPVLPIQNHIKFPNFWIFNDSNFKKHPLSKPHVAAYKMNGNDIRLLSNQLSSFLKRKVGTCMEFNEVYNKILDYIHQNDITAINEDNKLRNLFGISEDEDYEYSYPELIKILTKLLEPHLKKISSEN